MRFRVLPYKQGSKSAKALADALGGKVLKLEGSKYQYKNGDVLINWGHPLDTIPQPFIQRLAGLDHILNGYEIDGHSEVNKIKSASNKLNFFNKLKEVKPEIIPKFWTKKEDIPDAAFPIVCRTVLAGHSGAGIVIADNRNALVDAPLYVQYKKKKDEYRVHVGRKQSGDGAGESVVIAVQRKARRNGAETVNWQVRNLAGGFVFVRGGVSPPASVTSSAVEALAASGLDFGAVDVIYNEHEGKAYVLEINTAPGLEGQTIADYASFFKEMG